MSVNIVNSDGSLTQVAGNAAAGGLTPAEHDALMSIASMPARGDINPEKAIRGGGTYTQACGATSGAPNYLPVIGYDVISLYVIQNKSGALKWCDQDFNELSSATVPALTTWTDIQIPDNAYLLMVGSSGSGSGLYMNYALFTADSPYNPLNQTP